jgi:uncharacterized protein
MINTNAGKKIYLSSLSMAKKKKADLSKVSEKLMEAASLGSSDADYALATWYLHGKFFHKSWPKAIKYLKRSVIGGNSSACFDLAVCYETGKGTVRDKKKAFDLYLEAALRGDVAAHREVARCYWHGYGVRRNRVVADLWGGIHKLKSRSKRGNNSRAKID